MRQHKDNAGKGICINPWYKPSLPRIIKPMPILKMPSKVPMKNKPTIKRATKKITQSFIPLLSAGGATLSHYVQSTSNNKNEE